MAKEKEPKTPANEVPVEYVDGEKQVVYTDKQIKKDLIEKDGQMIFKDVDKNIEHPAWQADDNTIPMEPNKEKITLKKSKGMDFEL